MPLKYTDMICWEDGIMFSAEYRRKWGVINIKGEVIIPFKFDWISWPDKNGNIPACKAGKYGCLNMKGNVILPFVYDSVTFK